MGYDPLEIENETISDSLEGRRLSSLRNLSEDVLKYNYDTFSINTENVNESDILNKCSGISTDTASYSRNSKSESDILN